MDNVITKEDLQELGIEESTDESVQKANSLLAERIGLAVAGELDEAGLRELKAAVAEGKDLIEFARERVADLDDIVRDETDILLADFVSGKMSL